MDRNYSHVIDLLSEIYEDLPNKISEEEILRLRKINDEFIAGFRMLVNEGPLITVFGSSRTEPESPRYRMGYELGKALAKGGFAVLTGGGPGCMEAVNRGATEADGKSMGINIDIPNEQKANPYAIPSLTLTHFFVRKVLLLKYSKAYIFLPGGYGTLDELFETATLIQTGKIKPMPVILMESKFWKGIMEWLDKRVKNGDMIDEKDLGYFQFADTAEEAMEIVMKTRDV